MSPRCLTLVVICAVFLSTETVSGEVVKKAVGDEVSFPQDKEQEQRLNLTVRGEEVKVFGEVDRSVSFRPTSLNPPVSSIIWKHRNGGYVVKVIEWDVDDGFFIPHPRFKDITTLDEKTGQITITHLNAEHSGEYAIDINSKEQKPRFKLTVTGEVVKKAVGDEVSFPQDKEQEQRLNLTVRGEEVKVFGEVDRSVSFGATSLNPPVSSIIWKHRNGGYVVKVIEWDIEDGFFIPHPRFKDITTLDEKTGQITIANLNAEHSGEYAIDINSKEQKPRFTLIVTGEEVKVFGEVGRSVSFGPTSLNPPVSSIIWRHRNGGYVEKAIEWDFDDGVFIPNQRFRDITTLDEKTGQITITHLNAEHTGEYTIDINSKEQKPRFKLTVTGEVVKKAVGDEVSFPQDKEQEQRLNLTVRGEEVKVFGEVDRSVSFGATSLNPPVSSIIWKHRNGGYVEKVIEWDVDDGFSIPNARFKDITTLDEKTGQITITHLNAEHTGEYTIDINSKEQKPRFTLEVLAPVLKPVIKDIEN
ncbi:uncharacterized protein LOC127948880 isoform X1 [Carassius gibelio]|uniref:uncharacterized protein LOC127948880 isoform X1 n=1 Tax=Carassius gibelio TaxID=101364 RepID=UPI002278975E|nr:uncharacterized protein LOC127948880 isoform X1 [Carassius gibelio]